MPRAQRQPRSFKQPAPRQQTSSNLDLDIDNDDNLDDDLDFYPVRRPKQEKAPVNPAVAAAKLEKDRMTESLKLLKLAQECVGDNRFRIALFEEARIKGNLSYEKLGTSEEKVAQLIVDGFKAEAEKVLSHLRNFPMPQHAVHRIGQLDRYLERADLTYEDIGTTAAELDAFRPSLPATVAA